jgi:hypothetical protein
MVRTITEILKEANTINLNLLVNLWNEIANNKYKYDLLDIEFARESIMELVLKADGEDINKGKFYTFLKMK